MGYDLAQVENGYSYIKDDTVKTDSSYRPLSILYWDIFKTFPEDYIHHQ